MPEQDPGRNAPTAPGSSAAPGRHHRAFILTAKGRRNRLQEFWFLAAGESGSAEENIPSRGCFPVAQRLHKQKSRIKKIRLSLVGSA
jgi:hypothetical protein